MKKLFQNLAKNISNFLGTSYAFAIALFIVLVWIITGPVFQFSDIW